MVMYLEKMFWNTNTALYNNEVLTKLTENSYWLFIALAGCLPIFDPANEVGKKFIKRIVPHISLQIIVSMFLLIVSTALLAGKSYNPFIYFRF
jgi:alginate O-acetyltransferase complex protein AlgI